MTGLLLVGVGLFGLVFGFSHAERAAWRDPLTIRFGEVLARFALEEIWRIHQRPTASNGSQRQQLHGRCRARLCPARGRYLADRDRAWCTATILKNLLLHLT